MRKEILKRSRTIISLLIVVTCCACSSPLVKTLPKQAVKPVNKEAARRSANDRLIDHSPLRQYGDSASNTYTFRKCNLYNTADTNSTVMRTIDAFSPITCINRREQMFADTIRKPGQPPYVAEGMRIVYEVKAGADRGFINGADIPDCILRDSSAVYLLGVDYSQPDPKKQFIIRKISWPEKKQLAVIEREAVPEAEIEAFLTEGRGLNNVNRIIKVAAHADFCGGGDTGMFIADLGSKLVELPGSFLSSDDGGGVDDVQIFLPKVSADNKWSLMKDILGQHFETPKGLAVPDLHFPMNELIGETSLQGQYAMDINNEMIKLKKGGYKMETPLTLTTCFYHWDGKT